MESSRTELLKRKLACELLPTGRVICPDLGRCCHTTTPKLYCAATKVFSVFWVRSRSPRILMTWASCCGVINLTIKMGRRNYPPCFKHKHLLGIKTQRLITPAEVRPKFETNVLGVYGGRGLTI